MQAAKNKIIITSQPGPQTAFLASSADIAIYGGSAGSGKTFALLLEPLRHFKNSKFTGVIFRRSTTQIRAPGGLFDESMNLYTHFKASARESFLEWTFPSGMTMKFAHMEMERTKFDWQGSAIVFLGFDELIHFSESQLVYMLSRNRSMSGVPGYVRATCNPDADSWVRRWIDWWIGEDGYPIKERSGVIRYFIRVDDKMVFADTKEELLAQYGSEQLPKSLTFISASIFDNQILIQKDPAYLANLRALGRVERLRLLEGNWNIKPSAGNYFQKEYFEILDAVNAHVVNDVRAWDRASTKVSETNPDPDWTVGVRMQKLHTGICVVTDVVRFRGTPLEVERAIKNTASQDGYGVTISLAQDPGSSGVADVENLVRQLQGYIVVVTKPSTDKITRARPVSAQAEANNIKVKRAFWNEDFFKETESFPDGAHDDTVDALADCFNAIAGAQASILDSY